MSWIVIGVLLILFCVVQLLFTRRTHEYYRVRNQGRSRWWQNPRGWSVAMVWYAGIVAVLGGMFLLLFGVSQRSGWIPSESLQQPTGRALRNVQHHPWHDISSCPLSSASVLPWSATAASVISTMRSRRSPGVGMAGVYRAGMACP